MKNTRDIITRLLGNLGSRKEVEQYLRAYSSVESKKFGVVHVGRGVLARDLEALASSLTFLNQVGLYPIVVHGTDDESGDAGVRRRAMLRENLALVEALEELGTRARPITSGVFEVDTHNNDVARVHVAAVEAAVRAGALPILPSIGETAAGQLAPVTTDAAARALALGLEPYKIVFLTEAGGLVGGDGALVEAVNLAEDWERIAMDPAMRRDVEPVKLLLDKLPHTSSVSITSPDHLARELFTHRGSGTLVRMGERIRNIEPPETSGLDRERLRALLEKCFGRKLADDYFDKKRFDRIYLAESYRATAILTREGDGEVPYLDKFAVTTEAQGAGIGGSIWERMVRDNPKLYWRSRVENPVNGWYFERAQGSCKRGRWTVFWYGLDGWREIEACVERAVALPASFEDFPHV